MRALFVRGIWGAVLLALGMGLVGCSVPGAAATPTALTEADLKTATYAMEGAGEVTLADGQWEKQYGADESMVYKVGLVQSALGDLDADGAGDGVAILSFYSGGSGNFIYLTAMMNKSGRSRQVAQQFLGDRVAVESLRIEKGVVTLDVVRQGPDDPMCCPSQKTTLRYVLKDGKLVTAPAP